MKLLNLKNSINQYLPIHYLIKCCSEKFKKNYIYIVQFRLELFNELFNKFLNSVHLFYNIK